MDDVTLTMKPDGGIEITLPKMDDDADTPYHVAFLSAIAARVFTDPSFVEEQIEWLKEMIEEVEANDPQ